MPVPVRGWRAVLAAVKKWVLRAVRTVLVLVIIVVPMPVVLFVSKLVRSDRKREVAAEVLKKKNE